MRSVLDAWGRILRIEGLVHGVAFGPHQLVNMALHAEVELTASPEEYIQPLAGKALIAVPIAANIPVWEGVRREIGYGVQRGVCIGAQFPLVPGA